MSVIWILPEGAESGPHVQVRNHNTGDNTVVEPKRLLPWFFKKGLMWSATIGGTILGFIIFWPLGFVRMIGPYLYFKSRAINAIKGIFDSREYQQLHDAARAGQADDRRCRLAARDEQRGRAGAKSGPAATQAAGQAP